MAGMAALAVLAACSEREVILQGERFPVRAPLADSVPVEGEPAPVAPDATPKPEAREIALPAAQGNADWAQRGGGPRHAHGHVAFSASPVAVWSTGIGAGNSRKNRVAAAPVVAAAGSLPWTPALWSRRFRRAARCLWQADLAASFDRGGGVSGGGLAASGDRLYATTSYGEVVALDAASGRVLWRQRVDAPVVGAPAVDGGQVFVSARDGGAWALDADDGKVIWQVFAAPGKAGWLGAAAPTVGDRAVIFPTNAGDLSAVLRVGGGTKVWTASTAGKRLGRAYAFSPDVTGDAALVGGVLYAGTAAGRTVALDAGRAR